MQLPGFSAPGPGNTTHIGRERFDERKPCIPVTELHSAADRGCDGIRSRHGFPFGDCFEPERRGVSRRSAPFDLAA